MVFRNFTPKLTRNRARATHCHGREAATGIAQLHRVGRARTTIVRMEQDDEVVFVREVTAEDRRREALASARTLDAERTEAPDLVTARGGSKKRARAGVDFFGVDDEADAGSDEDEDEDEEDFEARIVRVKAEKMMTESEARFDAEKEYELRTWPDAATASAASAQPRGRKSGGGASSSSSEAVVEVEILLTPEEAAAGVAERLPAGGQLMDRGVVASRYGARAPEAAALATAPRHLLHVSGCVRPLHEMVGGELRLRVDAIMLRVEAHVSGAPQFDDTTLICVGRL